MSLSGLTQSYVPNTLDGLNVIDADQIYIDGQLVDLTNYVPYTGADKPVDVGAQPIRTTYAPVAANDVVNLDTLTNAVTFVDNSVALTYLNKITTSSQTVAGLVTFTNGLQTNANKDVALASTLIIDPNYPNATVSDGAVTAGSLFGTITSSMGVYQSTSSGDGGVLVLGSGLSTGRVRLIIHLLVNDSNPVAVSLAGSADGVNPYQSIASNTFPAGTTTFWTSDTTFSLSYPYLILTCNTVSPGTGATVQWYGLTLYQMGVAQTNVTMPAQTADRVVVLDGSKRLVASGINTTKLGYLDNVSSDIQTQLNVKLNLSGSNANQNIVLGSYKVQSSATPSAGDDYINKTYGDSMYALASALAAYLPLSGGTMTGNISMGSFKVTSNATPTASTDYITKGYGDSKYATTAALSNYVPYNGATGDLNMGSRFVTCASDPSNNNELTRKYYVDTLIAGRVPRTGDTSLIGDYATNGSITGGSLISTGGVRASFYTTASGVIGYNEITDKAKWWKIMSLGSTAYVEGHITYSVAGNHAHVHFIVSHMYNSSPSIRIVASSFYSAAVVEQLRLSTDNASIYNTAYVEMYLGNFDWYEDNINIYVYAVNSSPLNSTYSVYTSTKQAGTTSGFTYYTVSCPTAFDVAWNGNRIFYSGTELYLSGNIRPSGALVLSNIGDCRFYNGSADAYTPGSTANNLIIKSWWGIGYESYDGGVRISMDTRTGSAYFGGKLGVQTTTPEGDLHVQLAGAVNNYWGKLVVKTTSFWGDGCSSRSETAGTQYATMFPMMFIAPHIVSDTDGWCHIRMGRAGGVATGRWWEIANRSDGYFQIGVERSNQFSIHPNGAVNVCGASPYAVPNGYMARGSLTIGSGDQNYGWGAGWTGSTAGLLLECQDLTEIAVHDSGHRVASLMAYAGGAGRNAIYLGRDMGWGGASEIFIPFYRAYYSAGIPFFYNTGGAFLGTPGGNTGYIYLGGQSLVSTNNSPVNTVGNGYWYINTPGVYTLTMTGHAPAGSAEYFISLNCHNTNDLNTNGVRQLVACGWAAPECVISWTGWLTTTDLISFGCFNNYMTTPTRLTISIVLIQGT